MIRLAGASRMYVLIVLTAIYMSNIADRYVISTLIEPIKAELHLSDSSIGFLTGTALAIFYTSMGIPLGLIADRWNRRNLIVLSAGIWSCMTAACGVAATFGQLLFARIGVGIGEAGGTPSSQSMIADLFPISQRGFSAAIFSVGAALGSMLGAMAGGAISDAYGWRMAFFALAAPGLALSLLVWLTIGEPRRGATDAHPMAASKPTIRESVRFILAQRALLHVLAASTVCTFWTWGLLWWTPAYLTRSFHLSTGQAGSLLGLINGAGGILAAALGGALLHRLRGGIRRQCRIIGIIMACGTIASVVVYTSHDISTVRRALWLFIPLGYFYLVPVFSWTQSLVPPQMRALVCAIMLFAGNAANLAIAPQLLGIASDLVAARGGVGTESLRWVLAVASLSGFWAAFHFWAAGERAAQDLVRAGSLHPLRG